MTAKMDETDKMADVKRCVEIATELEKTMNENVKYWRILLSVKMTPDEQRICSKRITDMTEMFYRVFNEVSSVVMKLRRNTDLALHSHVESCDKLDEALRNNVEICDGLEKECDSIDSLTKIRQEKFDKLNLARVMQETIEESYSRLVKTRDDVDSF